MVSSERDLVLGTAGHIDHGKTALVRALTGVDTDRLPAEKQRGITIDLGFAALTLGPHRLAIVDVPGHERFVRNMLAGASGLDLAMLVIAADDSVMPQTREHLEILRLLGLAGGLVVLTKCDLAEPSWIRLVEDEVRELVRGTFLEDAAIVRTSVVTGLGLDELKAELARLCDRVMVRQDSGLFRMAIDRSFTVAGHGTVVTGTVASGSVSPGEDLEWQPAGRSVRVRGLHRHDQPVERLGARFAWGDQPGGRAPRRDSQGTGTRRAWLSGSDARTFRGACLLAGCRPSAPAPQPIPRAPGYGGSGIDPVPAGSQRADTGRLTSSASFFFPSRLSPSSGSRW